MFDFFKNHNKPAEQPAQEMVLAPGDFRFQNMRHWSDLEDTSLSSLCFGFIEIVDTVPQSVRPANRLVTLEEFSALKRYSLAVGICRKAHFQYKVFDYNCAQLLDSLDFAEDGTASFEDSSLNEIYTQVNALWQNAIVSGDKFLGWLGHDLEDRFGKGSDTCKAWQDAFAAAADVSLLCDFCFRNPTMVERDFLFLNMSHVDFERHRTGFALNMDVGFMDHDLGESLRTKILTIMKDRQERGLPPQQTVVEMTQRFRTHVALLYATYLEAMMRDADKTTELVDHLIEIDHLNCVVLTPAATSSASDAPCLVYRFPSPGMVESYLSISDKLRQKWQSLA